MATRKVKTTVIRNYDDNKVYAKNLNESCGIKVYADRVKKK